MADVAGSFSLLRMAVALYPSNKIQCLWPGVHSPWQRCCLSYILLGCAACFRSPSGPPRRVRNAQSFAHALGTPTNAARRMATPPSISRPISLCCSIAPATTLRVHSTLGNGSAGGMLLSQRRIEPATSVCVECYQTCNPRYLASTMGKRSAFFRHTVGDCACSCQVSSRSVSTSRQTYAEMLSAVNTVTTLPLVLNFLRRKPSSPTSAKNCLFPVGARQHGGIKRAPSASPDCDAKHTLLSPEQTDE
jgi:hypothetical protein